MKTTRPICYCTLFVLLLLAGSCKTRKAVKEETGLPGTHTAFFQKLQQDAFAFRTLTARLHVDLSIPGKSLNSRVDLKMIKDEAFQLSVQPFLGIEIVRAEISVDSIKVIDRMNKRYVAESLSALKGELPVDFNFYNLQALFTNQVFYPGEQSLTPRLYKRFGLDVNGETALITAKDALDLVYLFTTDAGQKLIDTSISDDGERYSVLWKYGDFRLAGTRPFPMQMDVRLSGNGKIQGELRMTYSRIELDKPLSLGISVPSKYKRVPFSEIVKSLSSKKK